LTGSAAGADTEGVSATTATFAATATATGAAVVAAVDGGTSATGFGSSAGFAVVAAASAFTGGFQDLAGDSVDAPGVPKREAAVNEFKGTHRHKDSGNEARNLCGSENEHLKGENSVVTAYKPGDVVVDDAAVDVVDDVLVEVPEPPAAAAAAAARLAAHDDAGDAEAAAGDAAVEEALDTDFTPAKPPTAALGDDAVDGVDVPVVDPAAAAAARFAAHDDAGDAAAAAGVPTRCHSDVTPSAASAHENRRQR
jgi:hypothetical protein